MQTLKNNLWGGVMALAVIGGIFFWFLSRDTMPVSEETTDLTPILEVLPEATPSTVVSVKTGEPQASPAFPVNTKDTIASWDFKGRYAGNEVLTTKAEGNIQHLKSLIGKGEFNDYELYLGIANEYAYLGQGAFAYAYYTQAIALIPSKALAYANLGYLMAELGALETAKDAYEKAFSVEPNIPQYKTMLDQFMAQYFPDGN